MSKEETLKIASTFHPEVIKFLETHSSVVTDGDDKYFFLPFWFKQLPDGTFEYIRLNKMEGSRIKDLLIKHREP
jgi:hypothetical protein